LICIALQRCFTGAYRLILIPFINPGAFVMDTLQSLIIQSVQLLFIGMGTVFIILGLLIFLISLVSKLLPEEIVEHHFAAPKTSNSISTRTDNKELIAVISTAVSTFRKRNSSN
jgi:oxaloacetate decarboxylase (Na+ extruding) subunit gamma